MLILTVVENAAEKLGFIICTEHAVWRWS